jgi:hypothetical protein
MKSSNAILFAVSFLFALAALFWPQIENAFIKSYHAEGKASGNATKCPLVR